MLAESLYTWLKVTKQTNPAEDGNSHWFHLLFVKKIVK